MRVDVRARAARRAARALAALAAPLALYLAPQPVLAHQLNERYQAPLPLIVYVAGAAFAVAMSFVFVMLRNAPAPRDATATAEKPARRVPPWLRYGLQAVGLIAWVWVVVQTFTGGVGDGDVSSLFLWVYGWVGVALLSALLGPVWAWLNPFATIHQLLSAAAARVGLSGGAPAAYPERLGRWPAIVGFIIVIWLELVGRVEGGRDLGLFLIAYTLVTVAAMGYFGRETWRTRGETFSVWFDVLGRLAPFALDGGPEEGRVRRRSFASGLMSAPWTLDELVLVSLATGAIIFDGLSQTQAYFDFFIVQSPLGDALVRDTITGTAFIGGVTLLVLVVARVLTVRAVAAGLLPVAVGYLIAHYLTYLLTDGQRIIAALNDPLLRGDNLLPGNLGFWQPSAFIPTSIVWTVQLAAVVGGHIVGAWAGHAVLAQDEGRAPALRQLPLALLMVTLTTITLWSLGQAVLVTTPASG
jgi:hypothetical protein